MDIYFIFILLLMSVIVLLYLILSIMIVSDIVPRRKKERKGITQRKDEFLYEGKRLNMQLNDIVKMMNEEKEAEKRTSGMILCAAIRPLKAHRTFPKSAQ